MSYERLGTCYYESYQAAVREYPGEVDVALDEGSIKVGKPPVGERGYYEDWEIYGIEDGRYFIKKIAPKPKQLDPDRDETEELSLLVANGHRLELPKGQKLKHYSLIKRRLTIAGGSYRNNGFEFKGDAADVLERLLAGEVINDKKRFQFFATPKALATRVAQKAELHEGISLLEPEAGQGALVEAALDVCEAIDLQLVELMEENCDTLRPKGFSPMHADFLECSPAHIGRFDRIIANPPFSKGQDIDHIRHMYDFLKPEGILVAVASVSWREGSQSKQKAFREWLETLGAEIESIEAGAFKESGTNVETCLIKIKSPIASETAETQTTEAVLEQQFLF